MPAPMVPRPINPTFMRADATNDLRVRGFSGQGLRAVRFRGRGLRPLGVCRCLPFRGRGLRPPGPVAAPLVPRYALLPAPSPWVRAEPRELGAQPTRVDREEFFVSLSRRRAGPHT